MDFQPTTVGYLQGVRTSPGEYHIPAVLAKERERIFARSWKCVGRAALIGRPGDCFPVRRRRRIDPQ